MVSIWFCPGSNSSEIKINNWYYINPLCKFQMCCRCETIILCTSGHNFEPGWQMWSWQDQFAFGPYCDTGTLHHFCLLHIQLILWYLCYIQCRYETFMALALIIYNKYFPTGVRRWRQTDTVNEASILGCHVTTSFSTSGPV